jgi:predicted TIM-barrel fold metal-dependent hydrolase
MPGSGSETTVTGLPFIDAHMHLWDLARLHYAWLSPPFSSDPASDDISRIAHTYLPMHYRRETANWNVVGSVHVQAGAADEETVAETDWLESVAALQGLPSALVAFARLDDPEVETTLAALAQRKRVRGIRHMVNWHSDPARSYTLRDVTGDAAWARGFGLLSRHGFSFDLQAYPGQFPALARLIASHPQTSVILDHAGMGIDHDAAGEHEWRDGMKRLAALPNVSVKISGLGMAFKPWDAAHARDRARATIDLFGTERCMLASNFPTDRMFASFDATLSALAEAVADYSESERRARFAQNAQRIYRLALHTPS